MRNRYGLKTSFSDVLIPSNPGNPTVVVYGSSRGSDGCLKLSPVDSYNIQEKIESFRSSCDISLLLSRYFSGDTSALTRASGFFGDFSNMPNSPAGWFDLVERSEAAFNSLPVEVKRKFDNNVGLWFSSVGTPEWFSKMSIDSSEDGDVNES